MVISNNIPKYHIILHTPSNGDDDDGGSNNNTTNNHKNNLYCAKILYQNNAFSFGTINIIIRPSDFSMTSKCFFLY